MNVRTSPAHSGAEAAVEYARNFSAAVSMERARRFFEARQLYLTALKVKPDDGAALEGAARMAAAAGEHRAAIEHLRAAVVADPKRSSARERLIAAMASVVGSQSSSAICRYINIMNLIGLSCLEFGPSRMRSTLSYRATNDLLQKRHGLQTGLTSRTG